MQESTIKQKLTNYYYFVIFNSVLALLVSLYYLPFFYETPKNLWLVSFLAINHLTHIVFLTFIVGIIALPILWLKAIYRNILLALIAILGLGILYIDTVIFLGDSVHISNLQTLITIPLKIFFYSSSKSIFYALISILLLLICEILLIKSIEKRNRLPSYKPFIYLAIPLIISLTICHTCYLWVFSKDKSYIQWATSYLPVFHQLGDNGLMKKTNITQKKGIMTIEDYVFNQDNNLNYPLNPLVIKPPAKPINIVIIAIDAWRADCFNEQDSPNLWNFAQTGTIFNNHRSSGNRTQSGLFGLFYGIPETYWYACWQKMQPPALFEILKKVNYQIEFFSAGKLPCQLTFINVANLRNLYRGSGSERDIQITNEWIQWFNKCNKQQNFFSFIFYKSLHDGPDFPEEYSHNIPKAGDYKYKEFITDVGSDKFIKSYKTATHFIDSLAGKVLTALQLSGELDNTLVIITSDHGCEFNETNKNCWGYGSNYNDPQIKVPFAIIGPKFNDNSVSWQANHLTTHYDLAPTLMTNYLGVTNPAKDYSIGIDLLGKDCSDDFSLVVSSCKSSIKWAIVEEHSFTKFLLSGYYQVFDKLNNPLNNKTFNKKHVDKALEMITRFFKK